MKIIQPTINIRSDEVQELISAVPNWIIRWGITLFFLLIFLFLGLGWLIHYPDLVRAPLRLTSLNSPKAVSTKMDGKLVSLFVKEHQNVNEGQVLGFLESIADHKEVIDLSIQLDSLNKQLLNNDLSSPLHFNNRLDRKLGELQSAYQTFNTSLIQFCSFQTHGYYSLKSNLLKQELEDLEGLARNLHVQLHILEQDWEIAQTDYKVQKELANQKVIASMELNKESSKLLAKELPVKQIQSELLQNHSLQTNKLNQLLELSKQTEEQKSIFLQNLNTFRSEVESWKQRYLLIAPVSGIVYFSKLIEEKQILKANDEVFYISSENKQFYGEVLVPQQNLGKIRIGQDVLIKFESYPFQQYGLLKGKLTYLSEIPINENTYLAKVSLPDINLPVKKGKRLKYKVGMKATAEVVTDDTRLVEKLLYSFQKALNDE